MNVDELQALLERADADVPPVALDGLGDRIRRRARRRARARRGSGAAIAVLLGLVMLGRVHHRALERPGDTGPTAVQIAQWRAEVAGLDTAAQLHQRTADALRRSLARRPSTSAQPPEIIEQLNPLLAIEEARNRTALLLVHEATRDLNEPGQRARAVEDLRRAAQLFPDTSAGRAAAERLKILDTRA